MESVPFAFCNAMCGLMSWRFIRSLAELPVTSNDRIWTTAAQRNLKPNCLILICIGHNNGVWKLKLQTLFSFIRDREENMTLEELKEIGRNRICVYQVGINNREDVQDSSLDELTAIAEYIAPCVDDALFFASQGTEYPEDALSELLSIFQNCNFQFSVMNIQSYAKPLQDFLQVQLLCNELKEFTLAGHGWTAELRSPLEEFLLRSSYKEVRIRSEAIRFNVQFFQRLFWKRNVRGTSGLSAMFYLGNDDIFEFEKDRMQMLGYGSYSWNRGDGVTVSIKQKGDESEIVLQQHL